MGQTRIDTIARVLSSPLEQEQAILKEYETTKLEKLQQVLKLHDESLFEPARVFRACLTAQIDTARKLSESAWREGCVDQSPRGRSLASEDLACIHICAQKIRATKNFNENVLLFQQLLVYDPDLSEPIVREAAVATLADLYMSFPEEHRLERVGRPLAVAIGLKFWPTRSGEIDWAQVERFAHTQLRRRPQWLLADSGWSSHEAVAQAVKTLSSVPYRDETARFFNEYRSS